MGKDVVGDGSYGRDNHPSNIKLRVIRVILVLPVKYSLEPGGIFEFNRWWAFCFGVFDFKCRFGVFD